MYTHLCRYECMHTCTHTHTTHTHKRTHTICCCDCPNLFNLTTTNLMFRTAINSNRISKQFAGNDSILRQPWTCWAIFTYVCIICYRIWATVKAALRPTPYVHSLQKTGRHSSTAIVYHNLVWITYIPMHLIYKWKRTKVQTLSAVATTACTWCKHCWFKSTQLGCTSLRCLACCYCRVSCVHSLVPG